MLLYEPMQGLRHYKADRLVTYKRMEEVRDERDSAILTCVQMRGRGRVDHVCVMVISQLVSCAVYLPVLV